MRTRPDVNTAQRPWGSESAHCGAPEEARNGWTTGITNQPVPRAGVSTGRYVQGTASSTISAAPPPLTKLTCLREPDRMALEKYSTWCTHTRWRSCAWLIVNRHLKDGRHCLRDVVAIDLVPKEVAHVPRSDASPVLLNHHLARLAHDEQRLNHLLFAKRGALLRGEGFC